MRLLCNDQVEELVPDALGFAGQVYEHVLGEEKYTFIEDVKNPHSCTILVKVSRPSARVAPTHAYAHACARLLMWSGR